jgi:AraC-like DNA-binding protein
MFNAVVGMSMRAYIRHERVNLAADLLLGTTNQVTVIALECGFYDLPHFDKAFRREVGVAPVSFRRQHRVALPDRSIQHLPGRPADGVSAP